MHQHPIDHLDIETMPAIVYVPVELTIMYILYTQCSLALFARVQCSLSTLLHSCDCVLVVCILQVLL